MIRYTGINHLALVTADLPGTIRFWRDLLGLRLVVGLGKAGFRHYFFELSETDLIAFFEWPQAEAIAVKDHGAPVSGPAAFDHVSLGVENDEALWELKGRLEGAGFWVSEMIDHGFIHSIYAFDPNNIPIEFSAPVPEVDVRRQPRLIDRDPLEVAQEGPNPQPDQWPAPRPVPLSNRQIFPGAGRSVADAH